MFFCDRHPPGHFKRSARPLGKQPQKGGGGSSTRGFDLFVRRRAKLFLTLPQGWKDNQKDRSLKPVDHRISSPWITGSRGLRRSPPMLHNQAYVTPLLPTFVPPTAADADFNGLSYLASFKKQGIKR